MQLGDHEHITIRDHDEVPVRIEEAFSLNSTATIVLLFGDDQWGSTITVGEGVTPELSGTLDLRFTSAAHPEELVGMRYDLFDWNTSPLESEFAAVTSSPGFVWDLGELYLTGEVQLLAVPEPAGRQLLLCVLFGGCAFVCGRR